MSVKLCVLASGSSGNSTYVASNQTRILIDAGLSAKQTELRLASVNTHISEIDAICISHEHSDHTNGIRILSKRYQIPIYTNYATAKMLNKNDKGNNLKFNLFESGSTFSIGNFILESFKIPHDASEPVGFCISKNDTKIGIVTDIGTQTDLVIQKLKGCCCLVLESNHDLDLLQEAPRPWILKQRIRSRQGHLSNIEAAQLIIDCATPKLNHVILAHLSSECNSPEIALKTIHSQLRLNKLDHFSIEVSHANQPTNMWISE